LTEITLRTELAERMGVSERTLRRWIAGGDGSAKGLTRAVALRNRGWMRA
jgi:predicted site-specific integrase-resolvase